MFKSQRNPHLRQAVYGVGITFLTFWIVLASLNTKTQLEQVLDRGVITFATLNGPLSYYIYRGQPAGAEYQLAKAFADHLGVSLQIRAFDDLPHLHRALRDRSVQIANPGLIRFEYETTDFLRGPAYRSDQLLLIYRQQSGFEPVSELSELVGARIEVIQSSPADLYLEQTKEALPKLRWRKRARFNELDLLTRVQNREIEYTLISRQLWERYESYHPELRVAFEIDQPRNVYWLTRKHQDTSLQSAINRFFERPTTQQLLSELAEPEPLPVNPLNYYETTAFRQGMETRYQELKPYFRQAAALSPFDLTLLSAIAYQESHWREDAVSPTGVRGIMMLTEAAAAEVEVTDRTDPQQSILGGARYLENVMQKIPERIEGEDRLWFSLAAYNVGYGHLEDARVLTAQAGKDADVWEHVAEHLPLLEDEAYYTQTRYGFARGSEPVNYVRNIRNYMHVLATEEHLSQLRTLRINPIE